VTGTPERPPDVEIGARVRAKSLTVRRKGKGRVEFPSEPPAESERVDERKNLPAEVEPGVTYRNIEIRWAARAWQRDRP
jgi:hypothetical protein